MISVVTRHRAWAASSLKIVEGWPEGPGYKLIPPSEKGYSAVVAEIQSIAGVPLSALKGKFHTVYGSGGYIYGLDATGQIALIKSGKGSQPSQNTGVMSPVSGQLMEQPKADGAPTSKSWLMPLLLTGVVLLVIGGVGYKLIKPKLAGKKKASVVVK
jgi:hypothetical protein